VDSIQVSKMQGGGTGVWGKYYAASALKGSIDGVPIRIIDDNLDGKITQDGSDAIVIGRSPFAQPLYRIHQIGASFYEIKVDEDGKGLSFGKVSDLKPVTVKSPLLKLGATKALVVADSDSGQAFDLVAAKSGIPAGTYSLCYGVISAGKDVVVIRPGKETEKVTVSESPSTLTLGAPLKVNFDGRLVGNKVEVFPNLTVVGAGGESYDPDFGSTLSRPSVLLMEGTKVLIRQQMEYG
jgi:hypothetical protein